MQQTFRIKTRAVLTEGIFNVSGYPHLGSIEYVDRFTWKAADKLTGKQVLIYKVHGRYILYYLLHKNPLDK